MKNHSNSVELSQLASTLALAYNILAILQLCYLEGEIIGEDVFIFRGYSSKNKQFFNDSWQMTDIM